MPPAEDLSTYRVTAHSAQETTLSRAAPLDPKPITIHKKAGGAIGSIDSPYMQPRQTAVAIAHAQRGSYLTFPQGQTLETAQAIINLNLTDADRQARTDALWGR